MGKPGIDLAIHQPEERVKRTRFEPAPVITQTFPSRRPLIPR
jgi:hypothetical protein